MHVLKGFFAASLLITSLGATEIPLIGIDAKGEAVEEAVSEMEFKGWMKKAVTASKDILSEEPQMKTESQGGLSLKQVNLGFGFKAEVGLGDVVKGKVEPVVEFKFKRSN